ncbi:hypothetical protein AKJ09_11452 [Labilithrix luteola]|uniref:Asl1-like glycosyl hydrolase catalytic domain-containing protein n=1 Tax=Labilithrix luteola TaxID=1391654 RepID=A0A0K1QGA2_9BACT|nr:hypothetical protein [Labilithrix luteola]AKV04789.1 hypothetical protein AKJ09_11452 [Labilithrix luteola]
MTKQTSRREMLRLLAATGAMVAGCSSEDDALRDPSNDQPQNADVESSGEDASFTPAQDASSEANDAGPTTPTLDVPFYGVNIHPDYFRPNAQLVSLLQMLRVKHVRVDVYSEATANTIVGFAPALAAAGIQLVACITPGLHHGEDEQANYQSAYDLTKTIVTKLAPHVSIYECGNELDRDAYTYTGTPGALTGTYSNAVWPSWRGLLRGMIDAIKELQPTAKVGVDFCCSDFDAAQWMWDGSQPDGSTGHPKVRWDVSMLHWYRIYGDFDDAPNPFGGPNVNLVKEYVERFGCPVMFTEWGQIPEATGDELRNQIVDMMTKFVADRAHGLVSIFYYQLSLDEQRFGLIDGTWANLTPAGEVFVDFVEKNPVS